MTEKNYILYDDTKVMRGDYEGIKFNRDTELNAVSNGMIDISKYKNETILIRLSITCNGNNDMSRFFFFIFFSDYKNIFV